MPDYCRFIVLTAGRTGSMWLVEALTSHPRIICFGSVFEARANYVSYDVPGYDNFSETDRALRNADFVAFLRQRIFSEHDADVQAVGFKLQYRNAFGFPGLVKYLAEDRPLKVVHLRRNNMLRSLISLRLARQTGHYHLQPFQWNWSKARTAIRHPLRAIERARVRLAQRTYQPPKLTLSKEECEQYFQETKRSEAHYDSLFSEHERFNISYEELSDDPQPAFAGVQEFLGVSPRTLTYSQQRLNPVPTRDLLSNYDELRLVFKDTDRAAFFD